MKKQRKSVFILIKKKTLIWVSPPCLSASFRPVWVWRWGPASDVTGRATAYMLLWFHMQFVHRLFYCHHLKVTWKRFRNLPKIDSNQKGNKIMQIFFFNNFSCQCSRVSNSLNTARTENVCQMLLNRMKSDHFQIVPQRPKGCFKKNLSMFYLFSDWIGNLWGNSKKHSVSFKVLKFMWQQICVKLVTSFDQPESPV